MSVILERLSGAFLLNCELFALTLLFALPLGLVVAFGSMSRCRVLSGAVKTLCGHPRHAAHAADHRHLSGPRPAGHGEPLALRLRRPHGGGGGGLCHQLCLLLLEIYRGGIEAVPKGQTEAGQVLGMTKPQIFFKVTLLQVIKRILPPMGNEIITLVKDTSLANTIANKEIIMMAKEYSAKGLIWPLFSTAIFFLGVRGGSHPAVWLA